MNGVCESIAKRSTIYDARKSSLLTCRKVFIKSDFKAVSKVTVEARVDDWVDGRVCVVQPFNKCNDVLVQFAFPNVSTVVLIQTPAIPNVRDEERTPTNKNRQHNNGNRFDRFDVRF